MSKYRRKSPRLKGYDYAQSGAYFVTICTHGRVHLFGEVVGDSMQLSHAGEIAAERWRALPHHHPGVEVDGFVVMPNHVHAIIFIIEDPPGGNAGIAPTQGAVVGASPASPVKPSSMSPGSLPAIVGSYKSGVTRRIREILDQPDLQVWQRSYHDHIIRNQTALDTIRRYVVYNPSLWAEDRYYAAG